MGLRLWRLSVDFCNSTLSEKSMRNLIESKDLNFDLIVMEAVFSDCFLQFGHKFKARIIKFCTFGGTHWMGYWVGNPSPFSYVPYGFSDFNDRMGFWERFLNTFYGIFFHLGRQFYFLPRMEKVVRPFFKEADSSLPHLSELDATSTDLLLLNSHFSISYPRPLIPNVIQVGGLHVTEPNKLPEVSMLKI